MEKSAEELLIFIFDEILPQHGMNLRVKQRELSLEMLRALQENKLALCEAEVGTEKHTHISLHWRYITFIQIRRLRQSYPHPL